MNLKKLITTVFLMSLAAVLVGQTEAKREALSVFQEFLFAYNNSDAESIVNLFSEDAIFWGMESKAVAQDTGEIRQYFSKSANAQLDKDSPALKNYPYLNYQVIMFLSQVFGKSR